MPTGQHLGRSDMKDLRVYVAAAVTLILSGGGLATAASAETATAGSPARMAVARTAVASPADSSAPSSNNGCTSYYKWNVNLVPPPDSEAEWTSNPCNQRLQIRVWCSATGWSYSGKVQAVGLWDRAGCGFAESLTGAYIHFSYDNGATWTAYKKYWPTS